MLHKGKFIKQNKANLHKNRYNHAETEPDEGSTMHHTLHFNKENSKNIYNQPNHLLKYKHNEDSLRVKDSIEEPIEVN